MVRSRIAFPVSDIESAKAFYLNDLNLMQLGSFEDDLGEYIRIGGRSEFEFALRPDPDRDTRPYLELTGSETTEAANPWDRHHLAVIVPDIDEAFQAIVEEGGHDNISQIMTVTFSEKFKTRNFFTEDPEGRPVAIIQRIGDPAHPMVMNPDLSWTEADHAAAWMGGTERALEFFVDVVGIEEDWTMDLTQDLEMESGVEQTGGRKDEFVRSAGDFRFQLMGDETFEAPPHPDAFDYVEIPIDGVDAVIERVSEYPDASVVHGPKSSTIASSTLRYATIEDPRGYTIRLSEEL